MNKMWLKLFLISGFIGSLGVRAEQDWYTTEQHGNMSEELKNFSLLDFHISLLQAVMRDGGLTKAELRKEEGGECIGGAKVAFRLYNAPVILDAGSTMLMGLCSVKAMIRVLQEARRLVQNYIDEQLGLGREKPDIIEELKKHAAVDVTTVTEPEEQYKVSATQFYLFLVGACNNGVISQRAQNCRIALLKAIESEDVEAIEKASESIWEMRHRELLISLLHAMTQSNGFLTYADLNINIKSDKETQDKELIFIKNFNYLKHSSTEYYAVAPRIIKQIATVLENNNCRHLPADGLSYLTRMLLFDVIGTGNIYVLSALNGIFNKIGSISENATQCEIVKGSDFIHNLDGEVHEQILQNRAELVKAVKSENVHEIVAACAKPLHAKDLIPS